MRRFVGLVVLAFVLAPFASSHVFNHEDRHEYCQVYGAPQDHFIGDGHTHTHDPAVGASLPDHDPCKQLRMNYPGYADKAPLSEILPPAIEIDPLQVLFSDGDATNTEVFVGGEAYQFPVEEGKFRKRTSLAVTSDIQAAGLGFPGKGTYADPYIVEGYAITGNMLFKDTNACFVIRNNAIVNRIAISPLLPDPLNIIDLSALDPTFAALKEEALRLRAEYLNMSATWDALWTTWQENKSALDAEKAGLEAQRSAFAQQEAAWQDAFAQFEEDYLATVRQTELLADDFQAYAEQYTSAPQPARNHREFISADGQPVLDMAGLQGAFEAYQQDLDEDLTGEDVEGWVVGNPPPQDPPAGFWGTAEDWDYERMNFESYQADVLWYVEQYWSTLMASAPDGAAYAAFVAERAAFEASFADFMAAYNAFMVPYNAFVVDRNAFIAEMGLVWSETGADIAAADAHFAKSALFDFEYVGTLGKTLFNTVDELLDWVLKTLFGILDIDDPLNVARNTGQLILDWNGQCIHAYNNVAFDLRVNQNNDRTGYATGGIVEDNRFFTIGQIRHYDGIFRENEVGNRAHLYSLVDPKIAAPANDRSINNDGANQGWYYDNVIYGNVDLDFHGHHHSAGFFAPTSHYHGSTKSVAYMQTTTGTCTATYASPNATKANGPYKDHPTDNDVDVLGTRVLTTADSQNCLPHFDHGKRWTSVFFNDNLVIDPNGVGLRFEDRDHRQDDEQANSENMRELKQPHVHQKWVQLEDNTIVGKIFVDVLNAAGTDLWSDNWAKVAAPTGPARTTEALAHPGAEIINSHPYRNDAWVDVQGNDIFQTQTTGIVLADADDLTLYQLKDNRGFAVPKSTDLAMTPMQMLAWLQATAGRTADEVQGDIATWGGADRGVQTLASLAFLRDGFTVEHCGNVARGLDRGILATDRIYDDGRSIVRSCGPSDWGTADTEVQLTYTSIMATPERCTEPLREATADTDDFYVSEHVFDQVDPRVAPATCEQVFGATGLSITAEAQPAQPAPAPSPTIPLPGLAPIGTLNNVLGLP